MPKYKVLRDFTSADRRTFTKGETAEFGVAQAMPHLSEENQRKVLKGKDPVSIPANPELEPVEEEEDAASA